LRPCVAPSNGRVDSFQKLIQPFAAWRHSEPRRCATPMRYDGRENFSPKLRAMPSPRIHSLATETRYAPDRFPEKKFISIVIVFLHFCSIFNSVFKVEKMHSGSEFWAWVSFHTTILKF